MAIFYWIKRLISGLSEHHSNISKSICENDFFNLNINSIDMKYDRILNDNSVSYFDANYSKQEPHRASQIYSGYETAVNNAKFLLVVSTTGLEIFKQKTKHPLAGQGCCGFSCN